MAKKYAECELESHGACLLSFVCRSLTPFPFQTIRLELPYQERVGTSVDPPIPNACAALYVCVFFSPGCVKTQLMRKTGLENDQIELVGWDVPDGVSDDVGRKGRLYTFAVIEM